MAVTSTFRPRMMALRISGIDVSPAALGLASAARTGPHAAIWT
jgi:hypothetical protein